ncbi:MAG TPA: hypothetical protein VIH27_04370, partial [Nitrososphaerales archaeon]
LGNMIPFSFVGYMDFSGNQVTFSDKTQYERGLGALYVYNMKYPTDGSGPLKLAYMSPSLSQMRDGIFAGVIIYEVVK